MSDPEIVDDEEKSGEGRYGEEMAHEPAESEAVQPGDVYGDSESHWFGEFEDHEPDTPAGLYEEAESHWSAEIEDTDPHHRYGDTDPVPDDED